jgi:YVTN family beta-propeller protein
VEFRILGPLQVLDGERELPLGSRKERELLAVLLLHAGKVVSRQRLIDELWGESPPPTAAKALNVHVSQLRKALARYGHESVATRPPGYVLAVEPDAVDAVRFERLVAEARARTAAGDVRSAHGLLREALALWRGPALAGVELEGAARNEIGRLEELRLAAQMDRIDCELSLGLHEQLIGELEALVDEHPLRERLRGQLMLALYRSGRQADALRCYREARETLIDELGLEPSAPLQRLERAILNQDPSLDAPEGVLEDVERAPRQAPTRTEPSSRRRIVVGALVAVLAAIVFVVVLASRGGNGAKPLAIRPNSLVAIDPVSDRVVLSIPVSSGPTAVACGFGSLWVASRDGRSVARIDPASGAVERTVPLAGSPSAMAVGAGRVWVADGRASTIEAIDPDVGAARILLSLRRERFPSGLFRRVTALAVSGRTLWIATNRLQAVKFDADASRIRQILELPHSAAALVTAPSAVWAALPTTPGYTGANAPGIVAPIDVRTSALGQATVVGTQPQAIAYGEGSVWVANVDDGTVTQIDPATGSVKTTINVGTPPIAQGPCSTGVELCPGGIAAGAGGAWVTNARLGLVYHIDPRRGAVVARIGVRRAPIAIAVCAGRIWTLVG